MKLRTINSILCKKFDAWVATIGDEAVRKLVEKNTICTGGAIASMLLNEDINDFDFYFRDFETVNAVARYYVRKFLENPPPKFASGGDTKVYVDAVEDAEAPGKQRVRVVVKSVGVASTEGDEGYKYFEGQPDGEEAEYVEKVMENGEKAKETGDKEAKPKYRVVFLSANAISLSDDVQLVVRFYGEPEAIHANYDYLHVTNFWTSWDRTVTVRKDALLSLMNKDLRYVGSRYPLCSLFRMRKFIQRGWKITAGQVLKIAVNLQKYNLLDLATLEEQLTGVDVAYFNDLVERLKKAEQEKGTAEDAVAAGKFSVDEAYLAQLVDKLF